MALDAVSKFSNMPLNELKLLASSCKTDLISARKVEDDKRYLLVGNDTAKTQFKNIADFLFTASIKDSVKIRENDNEMSSTFWRYLKKYYQIELDNNDILGLCEFLVQYNTLGKGYFVDNAYTNLFGLGKDGARLNNENFVYKIFLDSLNKKLDEILKVSQTSLNKKIDSFFLKIDDTVVGSPINDMTKAVLEFNKSFEYNYENYGKDFPSLTLQDKLLLKNNLDRFSNNNINKYSLFKKIIQTITFSPKGEIILDSNGNILFKKSAYSIVLAYIFDTDKDSSIKNVIYSVSQAFEVGNPIEENFQIFSRYQELIRKENIQTLMYVISVEYLKNNAFFEIIKDSFSYFPYKKSEDTIKPSSEIRYSISKTELSERQILLSSVSARNESMYVGDFQLSLEINVGDDFYVKKIPLVTYKRNFSFSGESRRLSSIDLIAYENIDVSKEVEKSLGISLDDFFDTENLKLNEIKWPFLSYDLSDDIENRLSKDYNNIPTLDNYFLKSVEPEYTKTIFSLFLKLDQDEQILNLDLFELIINTKQLDYNKLNDKLVLINFRNTLNTYIESAIKRELIFVYQYTGSVSKDKRSADDFEIASADSNDHLIFLDMKNCVFSNIEFRKLSDILGPVESGPITRLAANEVDGRSVSICILYKELNYLVRNIILSDLQEYVFTRLFLVRGLKNLFITNGERTPSDSIQSVYKNFTENNSIIPITNASIYKYLYANAYYLRVSNESDIIAYYYGHEDIIGGYGIFSNEVIEINNFIDIYHETRNVFYKVFLNKAFVNEDEYKLYEKLFISFTALERFLTSKIDNIHNIDYFDSNDVRNFLISYGLKPLTEMKKFIGQYDIQLTIVKYFNDLVKAKGSKKVVDILMNIFASSTTEIELKKYYLIKERETKKLGVNLPAEYSFVELPYTSDNEFQEIVNGLENKKSYLEFIDSDPYWAIENAPTSQLEKTNLAVNETKYTALNIKRNLSQEYLITRYALSTIVALDKQLYNANSLENKDAEDPKRIFGNVLGKMKLGIGSLEIYLYEIVGTLRFLTSIYKKLSSIQSNFAKTNQVGLETARAIPVFLEDFVVSIRNGHFFLGEVDLGVSSGSFKNIKTWLKADINNVIKLELVGDVPRIKIAGKYVPTSVKLPIIRVSKSKYMSKRDMESYNGDLLRDVSINDFLPKEGNYNLTKNSNSWIQIEPGQTIFIPAIQQFLSVNTIKNDEIYNSKFIALILEKIGTAKKGNTAAFDINKLLKTKIKVGDGPNTVKDINLIHSHNLDPVNDVFTTKPNIGYGVIPVFKDETVTKSDIWEYILDLVSSIKVYPNENQTDSRERLETYLLGLNNLFLEGKNLWAYYIKNCQDTITSRTQANFTEIVVPDLFTYMVNPIIQLPIDYFTGMFSLAKSDIDVFKNKDFKEIVECLLDEFYMSNTDVMNLESLSLDNLRSGTNVIDKIESLIPPEIKNVLKISYYEDNIDYPIVLEGINTENITYENTEIAIDSVTNIMIELIETFRAIFSSQEYAQINISMGENETRLSEYVTTAIEFFISYTTKLYNTTFSRVWNTKGESLNLTEDIKVTGNTVLTDSYLMDESLDCSRNVNTDGITFKETATANSKLKFQYRINAKTAAK